VGSHFLPFNGGGEAQRISQIGNIFSIGFGLTPSKLMVQMGHVESYPGFFLPFCQDMKQAYGIGATRHPDDHHLPQGDQSVPVDEIYDP
jgi:hypothetical protein